MMEVNKENNLITNSEVYKTYFGFGKDWTPLRFEPLKLISTNEFNFMVGRDKYLTALKEGSPEGLMLLENLKILLVNDIPESESYLPDEGKAILPGHLDNIPVKFQKLNVLTKVIKPSLNFIFKSGDKYYGISPIGLKNTIKRNCIDEETKRIREDLLEAAINDLDEEESNIFNFLYFHPVQTTLGKIVTMMLPGVRSSVVSGIVTYVCASKTDLKVNLDPNIFEVESSLITYYYNEKNYGPFNDGTTLGNSCMRGSGSTDQITFYEDNPDAVKMIVYIKNKKLEARALLWKTVSEEYVVDRIYYISNNVAIELAKYCKEKGYKTSYNSNNSNYGIEMMHEDKIIIQLNQLENREYQPYYDSMKYIDVVNNLIGRSKNSLANYNKTLKRNFVVLTLDGFRTGDVFRQNPWDDPPCPISIEGQTSQKAISDVYGKPLQNFRDITIVRKPFKGLMARKRVVTLLPDNIPTASSFVKEMIKRYNCIRPVLTLDKKSTYGLADKKDTVFSKFHDDYIMTDNSIFVKSINSHAIKKLYEYGEFREKLTLLKLKRLYANKLVSIKPEGISYLQEQFALLPGKFGLSSIRPSRSFMVKANNITTTSIMLKDIPVPIKYIKIIKNLTNGQN